MQQTQSETRRARRAVETSRKVNQIIKDYYRGAHEAKKEGKIIAWCGARVPVELLWAMDIYPMFPEQFATLCAAKKAAVPFCERAEEAGYSQDLCSYARTTIGHMLAGDELEAPRGGLPEPDLFLTTSMGCDTRIKWFEDMARVKNLPVRVIELGFGKDTFPLEEPLDEDLVEQHAEEIQELVPFLENITGKKLNMDKFVQTLELSQKAHKMLLEVYGLRKSRPCPMGSADAFSTIFPMMYMGGTEIAFNFYKELLEEVRQKVASGKGVVEDEKFRILWGNIPMWYNLGLFNYFEEYGGVVAIETQYFLPNTVDPQDPFRGLARKALSNCGNNSIMAFIKFTRRFIKDYHIDGVVLGYNRTCRPFYAVQSSVKRAIEEQLQVPTILLESDMADERNYSDAQAKMRIDSLIESILAKKKTGVVR